MNPVTRHCVECQRELPPDHPGAICAACLWGEALPAEDETPTLLSAHASEHTDHPPPLARPPGSGPVFHVAGHEVEREIARGGMGVVYRARDLVANRTVALKMLAPQIVDLERMRERFRVEVRAAAALDHPAILPVFRVGEAGDFPFFTMKLAAGGTLADRRARFAGRWRAIGELVATLAGAVSYAHSRGVLHRDIKPGNVLFDEADRPYLADFGLAKIIDSATALTVTTEFLGTPHYAAPEIVGGNVGAASVASDIWSLGALLYELLAGRLPFRAPGLPGLLRAIVEEEPDPLDTRAAQASGRLARDLRVICLKCLAKAPGARYASAGDLLEDLRAALEGRPIRARPAGAFERLIARARRNPALTALSIALGLALAGLVAAQWRENRLTRHALAGSLLNEARSTRLLGAFQRRSEALRRVEQSAEILPGPAARDELIAVLAWPRVEVLKRFRARMNHLAVAPDFRHYAQLTESAAEVCDFESDQVISRIPADPSVAPWVGPFDPAGKRLLIRDEHAMTIWDAASASPWVTVPGRWYAPCFSPDGAWFAAGARGQFLRLLDLASEPPQVRVLDRTPLDLRPLTFSPDGRQLLAKGADTPGAPLVIIDVEPGRVTQELPVPGREVVAAGAWGGSATDLFAGHFGGQVVRWNLGAPPEPTPFASVRRPVDVVGLFMANRVLITQSRDETTRLWDATTGDQLAAFPWSGARDVALVAGNRFVVRHVGEVLAGRLVGSEVCATTGLPPLLETHNMRHGRYVMALSIDGRRLAVSAEADLHLIDTDTMEVTDSLPEPAVYDACFSGDGATLGVAGIRELRRYAIPSVGKSMAAPLVSPLADTLGRICWCGEARGFAVGAGAELRLAPGGPGAESRRFAARIRDLDADVPSGKVVVVAAGAIRLGGSGSDWTSPATGSDEPTGAKLLRGGQRLLVSDDASYRLRDLGENREVWRRKHALRNGLYRPMAVSPSGRMAALALDEETVTLVDGATGRTITRLTHPRRGRIRALAISPDEHSVYVLTTAPLVLAWRLDCIVRELAARGLQLGVASGRQED